MEPQLSEVLQVHIYASLARLLPFSLGMPPPTLSIALILPGLPFPESISILLELSDRLSYDAQRKSVDMKLFTEINLL